MIQSEKLQMPAVTEHDLTRLEAAGTAITLPEATRWVAWPSGPPKSVEMAMLYGDLDQPGPYLVLVKWYPGYFSAPHHYLTDRLSLVISGTWWVGAGPVFDPDSTVPVSAGGFVRRIAHTPHYDGVKATSTQPAVIAIYGLAPVKFELVDPLEPGWRAG